MICKELEQIYCGYEIFECYNEEDCGKVWYEVPKLAYQHPINSVGNAQMYIQDELESTR